MSRNCCTFKTQAYKLVAILQFIKLLKIPISKLKSTQKYKCNKVLIYLLQKR